MVVGMDTQWSWVCLTSCGEYDLGMLQVAGMKDTLKRSNIAEFYDKVRWPRYTTAVHPGTPRVVHPSQACPSQGGLPDIS